MTEPMLTKIRAALLDMQLTEDLAKATKKAFYILIASRAIEIAGTLKQYEPWKGDAVFDIDPLTWHVKLLNADNLKLPDFPNVFVHIILPDGQETTFPFTYLYDDSWIVEKEAEAREEMRTEILARIEVSKKEKEQRRRLFIELQEEFGDL